MNVILLITRSCPSFQGGWEDDESLVEAAKRETVEEAGVRGQLEEPIVGMFPFQSGKPSAHVTSLHQGRCIAYMYAMHVEEELPVWPEGHERQRIWVGRVVMWLMPLACVHAKHMHSSCTTKVAAFLQLTTSMCSC